MVKKTTIINDPIYGFISLPSPLIRRLIDHKYYQRLRRIKQLGLTYLVYPGAIHTRFHHALGAMHLAQQAMDALRTKGHDITPDEYDGVLVAVLLHDVGHGPFSHALESSIVSGIHHEVLSALFMQRLNDEFEGALTTAIAIFNNTYPKHFLHQLVSGQLDVDRLDYLSRDSFFTGVSEGVVSYDRIIKMLEVHNDQLVVEAKGVYSVEKFLIARRLMYWQVYLHKTVLAAEYVLVNLLKRAKELVMQGHTLFATQPLQVFLTTEVTKQQFIDNPEYLDYFARLDDYDIYAAIKEWCFYPDFILSTLANNIVNRNLFKIEIQNIAFNKARVNEVKQAVADKYNLSKNEVKYFVITDEISNSAYNAHSENIKILYKDGTVVDVARASDQYNIESLAKPVKKHFLIYPKGLTS